MTTLLGFQMHFKRRKTKKKKKKIAASSYAEFLNTQCDASEMPKNKDREI